MSERRLLLGTTPTLVGYPRLRPDRLIEATPTGTPRAKVRTPATPDPAWENASIDTLTANVSTAAAVGDTEILVDLNFASANLAAAKVAVEAALVALSVPGGPGLAANLFADGIAADASVADFRVYLDASNAVLASAVPTAPFSSVQLDTVELAYSDEMVVAPAWVAGRRYLVADDGYTFVVESRASGASQTLRLASPLPEGISADATVAGYAVLIASDPTETATEGEAAVEWEATVAGEAVVWVDLFRIVRRIPKATLTPSRLLMLEPTMFSLQLPADVTHERVIAGAWERLQVILERNQILDEDVVSDEALVPLHAAQCVLLIVEKDPRFDRAFVEDLRTSFRILQDSVFNRKSYDEQGQLVAVTPRVTGVREERGRGIRVVR